MDNEQLKNLLADLVKQKSPYFHEEQAVRYVCDWFNKNNLPCSIHEYEDNVITNFKGVNAIGELKGTSEGPTVLLNGHIDTVDLCSGWTKDPYGAEVVDGKMYGLGALDMKAGVTAIMMAVKEFKNNYSEFSGSIKYQIVSDEEGPYGLGTNALIEDGLSDADVAIIPEPSSGFTHSSDEVVCLGARGGVSYKVNVHGISAHAANPDSGVNAIVEASKVICELKKLTTVHDEKLGYGCTAIIKVEGGGAPASIADLTTFNVFRHMVRGETKETVKEEVLQAAKNAGVSEKNIEVIFRDAPSEGSSAFLPYVCDENNSHIQTFLSSLKSVTGNEPKIDYFPSIGDFCYIGSRLNIPTIVYGPKGENYHSSDEYVELSSYYDTANVIYDFLVKTLVK